LTLPGTYFTLDRAIELARANNRETKRAQFDIDRQREASAEAKTSYYPRFDAYLLGTELLGPLKNGGFLRLRQVFYF
jgi:hypothetical protein